jgi:hypothetical protein
MAVHSNTFGGLRLTGDEAKKFRNQVKFGRNNAAAKAAARRGRGLAENLLRDGFVKIEA